VPITSDIQKEEDKEEAGERWHKIESKSDRETEGAYIHAPQLTRHVCGSCISYLLRKRTSDPYKDLVPRAAYERINSGQAPTFEP